MSGSLTIFSRVHGGACVHWISGPGSSLSSQPGSASLSFDPPTPKPETDIKGLKINKNLTSLFILEMQRILPKQGVQ